MTSPGSENWFDRPMRWAQLVLAENDPGQFDLCFWLDYFRRTHSDGVCLSAGGYVAYYPTRIPLHHRSAWLGDMDPFGELVAGCRRMGMVVLARTDPHAVHRDVCEAHPNWIAVDAEGRKRQHWATPGAWVTCALGPYNFEFMTEVHKEVVAMYQVDGTFSNRWAGHGVCYCEHCQRNFWDTCGMELPRTRDPQDPHWRSYLLWRQERLFELCRLWDAEIRKVNPRACYVPNSGGGALSDLDMRGLGEIVPLLFADRQGRRGLMAPWANGKNGKEFRAAFGRKPIGGIFSVGMVYSQQTAAFYGGERAQKKVEDHTLGMYQALVEARIPFEMAHDRLLDREHVGQFKTLVLPNIAALSDEQCQQIRDFVRRGGSVVATFETSLYDEWGVRRGNLGLADLFGVNAAGLVEGPVRNAYLRLEKDTGDRYDPLLAGLEDAERVIAGVYCVPVETTGSFPHPPLTLVPSYPDLPMEEVYPRFPKTDEPGIYLRESGESRIVYFPWDVDRIFWEVLNVDHGKLLRNAVQWATNEEQLVTVTGPGVLDVAIWRQENSMTVHLVNLTNPMMMRGPFRELVQVGEQVVRVRLPSGGRAKSVHLLKAGRKPEVIEGNRYLTITVPAVLDHEVIAVDL